MRSRDMIAKGKRKIGSLVETSGGKGNHEKKKESGNVSESRGRKVERPTHWSCGCGR